MNGDDKVFFAGFLMGGFIVFIVSALIWTAVLSKSDTAWQKSAVDRGFAEHDSKTGEWKWKESIDAEPSEGK
jgi:hypothetical protein